MVSGSGDPMEPTLRKNRKALARRAAPLPFPSGEGNIARRYLFLMSLVN
jgi:hypothetical protein